MMPSFYLVKLIFNQFLPKALQIHKRTVKTLQMFVFAETLCKETDVVKYIHMIHPSQSVDEIVFELAKHIRQRPINEVVSSQFKIEDSVLRYLFILLQTIFAKRPQARIQFEEKNELIGYLLSECLFMKNGKR